MVLHPYHALDPDLCPFPYPYLCPNPCHDPSDRNHIPSHNHLAHLHTLIRYSSLQILVGQLVSVSSELLERRCWHLEML
jgi:hypothetical protein